MQPTSEANQVLPVIADNDPFKNGREFERLRKEVYLIKMAKNGEHCKKIADELQARQANVRKIHNAMGKINALNAGDFDLKNNPALKAELDNLATLGVMINTQKLEYKKEERDRLIGNMSNTVGDLSMENERQTSELSRKQSELYETIQMCSKMEDRVSQLKKKMLDNGVQR